MAGKIRNAVTDRWHVLYRVYWRPAVAVVAAVYAVISLDSTLSGEFASDRVQKAIRLGNFVPHLSAWIWVTIGLALLLLLGTEGAVREFRRQDQAHAGALAERLAEQQAKHQVALDAQRVDYEKRTAEIAAPATVNSAEWKATCDESGEFPDTKALMFGVWHRFENRGARLAFGDLRCTVTDPDGITTSTTGTTNYYQYIEYFFKGAPPVRPGLYRFTWEGRKANGEWTVITSGEHEVKPPLTAEIMESKFDNWRRIAFIVAVRVKVTNNITVAGTANDVSSIAFTCDTEGLPGLSDILSRDERLELERELDALREGRQYAVPLSRNGPIPAGESIKGWVIGAVPRDPRGGTPSCAVVIKDKLGDEYRLTLPKREPQTYG